MSRLAPVCLSWISDNYIWFPAVIAQENIISVSSTESGMVTALSVSQPWNIPFVTVLSPDGCTALFSIRPAVASRRRQSAAELLLFYNITHHFSCVIFSDFAPF